MSRRGDAPLDGYTVLIEHPIAERFPLEISAIDAFEQRLVVGTADGSLVVLEGNLRGAQAGPSGRAEAERGVKARLLCQSRVTAPGLMRRAVMRCGDPDPSRSAHGRLKKFHSLPRAPAMRPLAPL